MLCFFRHFLDLGEDQEEKGSKVMMYVLIWSRDV